MLFYLYRNRGRKYTRRNFTPEGKIIIQLREGRERSDTYLKRTGTLIENSKKLHKLTGAHVKLSVIPTWKGGKEKGYTSEGFPTTVAKSESDRASTIVSSTSSTPVTPEPGTSPQKRYVTQPRARDEQSTPSSSQDDHDARPSSSQPAKKQKKNDDHDAQPSSSQPAKKKQKKNDENACAICGIQFNSAADNAMTYSYWLQCQYTSKKGKGKGKGGSTSSKGCTYWVHSFCVGVYYPRTRSGRFALDRWSPAHFFCPQHFPKDS